MLSRNIQFVMEWKTLRFLLSTARSDSLVQYVWSMLILYRVTGHQSFGLSPVNLYWQSPTNPISSQADAKLFQPTLTIRKKLSTRSP